MAPWSPQNSSRSSSPLLWSHHQINAPPLRRERFLVGSSKTPGVCGSDVTVVMDSWLQIFTLVQNPGAQFSGDSHGYTWSFFWDDFVFLCPISTLDYIEYIGGEFHPIISIIVCFGFCSGVTFVCIETFHHQVCSKDFTKYIEYCKKYQVGWDLSKQLVISCSSCSKEWLFGVKEWMQRVGRGTQIVLQTLEAEFDLSEEQLYE